MKVDLKEVMAYPFKDSRWIEKLLIGGGFGLVPLVNLVVLGYLMRVFQGGIRKNDRVLPAWSLNSLPSLFLLGVTVLILALCFSAPLLVLRAVADMFSGAGTLAITFNLLFVLLGFGLALISPFILASFLNKLDVDEVRSMDDFKRMLSAIKGCLDVRQTFQVFMSTFKDYIRVYLIMVALMFAALIMINMIPYVGFFIWLPVNFYLGLVTMRLFGELYPAASEDAPLSCVAQSVADSSAVMDADEIVDEDELNS